MPATSKQQFKFMKAVAPGLSKSEAKEYTEGQRFKKLKKYLGKK